MAFDRYLIAPYDESSGLNTSMRPWQIPDSAWAQMDNAYVFRGRVKKRVGSRYIGSTGASTVVDQLQSRLRRSLGNNTNAAMNLPANTTTHTPQLALGQIFSLGSDIFTVYQLGAGVATYTTNGAVTAVINSVAAPNTITFTGGAASPVYWYPSLPVMGFAQYEFTEINDYLTFAYDTEYAYVFTAGAWALSSGSPTWHGDDTDFFWSTNFAAPNAAATALTRSLFTTNFQVTNPNGAGVATDDPIYYYNNTTWTAYIPYLDPAGGAPTTGPFVQTARLIVPFKGRLVLLNTIENDGGGAGGTNTQFVTRARYSDVGNVFSANSWYPVGASDSAGNIGVTAGFEDASTLEAIVSCEFIKDRLIVYFEESTWELASTGNEQRPFQWLKLNTELGSMATFSTIAFDKAILTVGEVGIHSCNGSNVARIDQKIPSEIFTVSNPNTEVERICGVRDYYNEMVYWSIPVASQAPTQPFPTRMLVYNYQNQTWAFNDDCITAFGYFDGQPRLTWALLEGMTWEEWTNPWNSGQQQQNVRQIVAGNQQGWTFILDSEATANARVLYITNMAAAANGITMTIYDHMLKTGDYIYVKNARGVTLNGNNIYVVRFVDKNTIVAFYPAELNINATITGTYAGGGTAGRVSNYNLYSKQWNPYDNKGMNVYVAKIDFAVLKTDYGQVMVDYSPSSTPMSTLTDAAATQSLTGTGVLETSPYTLYPLEQQQSRLWHPVYFQSDGECIQINIYMSPIQICDPRVAFEDFELEAIVLHTKIASSRLQ
jgi:hypothetical protein